MNRSELTKLIRIAVAQGSPRHVYVSADKFAAYGAVKQALDAIHDAGVEEISFVTEQRSLYESLVPVPCPDSPFSVTFAPFMG